MARLYALLAVVTGLIASSSGIATVERRTTSDSLPSLTPSQIISSLSSSGLVKDINVFITPQSLVDNTISLNFDVQNSLPLEFTIDQLSTDAGLNGTTFLTFSHSFPSPGLVVPPLGTANSGTIDGVTLPQGILATIGITQFGEFDLSNLNASTRQLTINGSGGIPLPLSDLSQSSVPTVSAFTQTSLVLMHRSDTDASYSPNPAEFASSLSLGFIKDINLVFSPQSFVTNTVSLNFDVQNTLPLEFTIDQLSTDAGVNGTTFLTISRSFPSPGLVVPPLGTVNSGTMDGITLPRGALATIGIAPSGVLDLSNLNASTRQLTINGSGGIPLPLSDISQSGVPTVFSPNPAEIASSLSAGLIKDISIVFTPQTFTTNTVSLSFDVQNPIPFEITLDQLGTNAGLNGTTFLTFSHSFASPGLVVPAMGTVNSGTIDGVTLPQGALATLGIIPFGELDLSNLSASTRDLTINGSGGIPIPLSGLSQSSVPTVYSPAPAEIANSLSLGLIESINVVFSLQSLLTNTVSLNFNAQNAIPFEITIDQLGTNAGLNGTTFFTFSHSFPSPGLIVPALGTANSGSIDNVPLPQGALATLGIIPAQELDLTGLSASVRALTISGSNGFPIPLSGLSQSSVPTTYSGSALSSSPLSLLDRRDLLPPTPSQITDTITSEGLFKDITMSFSLTSIATNTASMSFDIQNPLSIQITISQIAADAGLNGTVFATFTQAFSSGLVVPALGSVNSGIISNVALPQGVLPFLEIVSDGELDIISESVSLEAFIIPGIGIPISLSGLTQTGVPTTYNLGGL